MIPALPLFDSSREWILFGAFLSVIFSINLFFDYRGFLHFKQDRIFDTQGRVVNQYTKTNAKNRTYEVMRIKTDEGFTLYTTSFEQIRNLKSRRVKISIITEGIDFIGYLRGFYAPSFGVHLLPKTVSPFQELAQAIAIQHENVYLKELFQALFLAIPPSKELREMFNFLGISHLIAISGFHLGVLSTLIIGILYLPYRILQQRFFPYRNRIHDLMLITMAFLVVYLVALDFVPSLLRAFGMMLLGFLLYWRGIKILSFQTLLVTVLCLIALFPKLLFSVGFWFSVSGVFYIYLFLHHFKHWPNWQIAIGLNLYVFLAMMPIVHLFFPLFSFHQLLSPVLTLAFTLFYPLEIGLHLIGQGGLLDFMIEYLMALEGPSTVLQNQNYLYGIFLLLSLGGAWYKEAFYGTLLFSGGFLLLGMMRAAGMGL